MTGLNLLNIAYEVYLCEHFQIYLNSCEMMALTILLETRYWIMATSVCLSITKVWQKVF